MTTAGTQPSPAGPENQRSRSRSPLLEAHRFLRRGPVSEEGWSQLVAKDRAWERSYRGRWQHDKVVRSTHGVNCTGSCSWNVYVKEGIITWESQAVDYPSVGPDMPEYEPRGCPRGASTELTPNRRRRSQWARRRMTDVHTILVPPRSE